MIRRLEKKKERIVGQNTVSVVTSGHVVGNPHTAKLREEYMNDVIDVMDVKLAS